MKKIGIIDSKIENIGINLPIFSGTMTPLKLKLLKNNSKILEWHKELFKLTAR